MFEHYMYEYVYNNNGLVTLHLLDGNGNPTESRVELSFNARGNRVGYKSLTAVSNSGAAYTFDENINPYVHMKWPEQFLEHESKNNAVTMGSYSGSGPVEIQTTSEYQYGNDGFPTQVLRKRLDPSTGQYVQYSRKVFTY
ncbi:MAG TPA: hypothetical protein VFZ78_08445 [Flavisolibacter sp.]